MPTPATVVAVIVASYLIGSLPFGLLLARVVAGVDVRRVGSGNVGATNVARAMGMRWFPLVLSVDAAKGAISPLFIARLALDDPALRVACAGAAITGHVFSAFLGFKGGKGVATTAGALLALRPEALGVGLAVFGLFFFLTRYVSLASVLAAVAVPVACERLGSADEITVFASLFAFVIIVQHRSNIVRLVKGTEPRVPLRPALTGEHEDPPPAEPAAHSHEEPDRE